MPPVQQIPGVIIMLALSRNSRISAIADSSSDLRSRLGQSRTWRGSA
jgi:hypothetical protein